MRKSPWGIDTYEELLANLRVAENGGDVAECVDTLEWLIAERRCECSDAPPARPDGETS